MYCSSQSYLKCRTVTGNTYDLLGINTVLIGFSFLALLKFFSLDNVLTSFLQPNILLKSMLLSSFSSDAIFSKSDGLDITERLGEKEIDSVADKVESAKPTSLKKNL